MNGPLLRSQDPDLLSAEIALRRAARRARVLGRRTGTPVYVMKGGRIVDLTEEWRRHTEKGAAQGQPAGTHTRSRR
ncbi:MAG TPA: hypothetical protein VMD08_02045 [Candidatus Baltobacteraceae bacterium]|nr:hypothetical protein [Candidatus Baltobacteraceae bacterium]